MLHLGVSWALGLRAHLSLIIFPTIILLHSTISHWLCSSYIFLSHFLLVLLYLFSTPSADPPRFITWRMVTSFPLFIPWTWIWRPLAWKGHIIGESLGYFNAWEHVHPLLILTLWGSFVYAEGVHLYMCKKRIKNKNKHMCVCA